MSDRHSIEVASATPTLHDEPLPEKNPPATSPESDDAPQVGPAHAVDDPESGGGGDDGDVLVVDWDGPDDPHNPRK